MLQRLVLCTFAFLAPIGSAFSQSIIDRAARDEITHMASEEPAMQQAFRRARETLDEFLLAAARPRVGTSGYALKVAISDGQTTEYFWLNSFSRQGDRFIGTLDNEPRLVKRHKFGERIEFLRAQVADWVYLDQASGRMVGNFTACALLSKELPAQAEEFKRRYGLQCE